MSSRGSRPGVEAYAAALEASSGSDADGAEPNHQIEILEQRLAEHTKHLNRLIGERNQLRELLDDRDQEIRQLHREIGALQQQLPVRHAGEPAPLLRRLLARWLAPIEPQPASGGATPAAARDKAAGTSLRGELPLVPRYRQQAPRPVLAAAVFGLDADAIEQLLPMIEAQCRNHAMQPLLLTDNAAFGPLRTRRMVFEYLPPAAARARLGDDLEWTLYLQRRLALIRRKWQPARIVAFGPQGLAMVQLWRDSPFEPDDIPAILAPPATRAAAAPHASAMSPAD